MEINQQLVNMFGQWYTDDPHGWTSPAEYFERNDQLLMLFKKWNITSLFDAGCSHRHWMQHIPFVEHSIKYSGGDVSIPAVEYCNKTWPELSIVHCDITTGTLPEVDVIFCNDVLIHLNNQHKLSFLKNFLHSNSKYLMMTHNGNYPHVIENLEVDYQQTFPWAPVDWNRDPWNFPPELDNIIDTNWKHVVNGKRVCLWSRDQLCPVVDNIGSVT